MNKMSLKTILLVWKWTILKTLLVFFAFSIIILSNTSDVNARNRSVKDFTYLPELYLTWDIDNVYNPWTEYCGTNRNPSLSVTWRCTSQMLQIGNWSKQNGWFSSSSIYWRDKLEQDGSATPSKVRPAFSINGFKYLIWDLWLTTWDWPSGWDSTNNIIGFAWSLWAYKKWWDTYDSFTWGYTLTLPYLWNEIYGNRPSMPASQWNQLKHWSSVRNPAKTCAEGQEWYNNCRNLWALWWMNWTDFNWQSCQVRWWDCVSPLVFSAVAQYKRLNVDLTDPTISPLNVPTDTSWKTYAWVTLAWTLTDQTSLSWAWNIYIKKGWTNWTVIASSAAESNGLETVTAFGAPISEWTWEYCATWNDRSWRVWVSQCSTLSKDSMAPIVLLPTGLEPIKTNTLTHTLNYQVEDDTSLTTQVSGLGQVEIQTPLGMVSTTPWVWTWSSTITLKPWIGKQNVSVRWYDNSTPRNYSAWTNQEYWVDTAKPDQLNDLDVNVTFNWRILTLTWNDKLDNWTGDSPIKNRDEVVPWTTTNYTSGINKYVVRYSIDWWPSVEVDVDKNVRSFSLYNSERSKLTIEIFAIDNVWNEWIPWVDNVNPTITMGGIDQNSTDNLPDTLSAWPITISVSDNKLEDGWQYYWTTNVTDSCSFSSDNVRTFVNWEVGTTTIPSFWQNKLCIRAYDIFGNYKDESKIYFRSQPDNLAPKVHIEGLKESSSENLPYTLSNWPIIIYTTDDIAPDGWQYYWSDPWKDCSFADNTRRDYLWSNKLTLTIPKPWLNKLCVRGYDMSDNLSDDLALYFYSNKQNSQWNPMDNPNSLELKINIIQKQKTLELIDRVVKDRE